MKLRCDVKFLGCCVLFLVCCGCATLSENECRTANWQAIGYEDGSQGRPAGYLAQHRKACAEYGVSPQLQAYRSGREQGLDNYCQAGNGYQQGLGGAVYQNVCPRELEPMFLSGYQRGREIYLLEQEVRSLDSKQRRHEKELEEVRAELEGVKDKEQIRKLAKEEGRLENQIRETERDRIQKSSQAQALREAAIGIRY